MLDHDQSLQQVDKRQMYTQQPVRYHKHDKYVTNQVHDCSGLEAAPVGKHMPTPGAQFSRCMMWRKAKKGKDLNRYEGYNQKGKQYAGGEGIVVMEFSGADAALKYVDV